MKKKTSVQILEHITTLLEKRYEHYRRTKNTNHPTARELVRQIAESDQELAEEREKEYYNGA